MNDQRRSYSFDEIFPERWLHAPDLDGRTVTLVITDAYAEYIENPKNHKKDDPGDLCGILSFRGTPREYVLSKQNAWILKALWGKDPAAYVGKRITLAPVPDSSGFTEHGTRILFVGSPDVQNDLSFNLPGGKHLTFKKTVVNAQTVTEPSVTAPTVDAVTGEVIPDRFTGSDDDNIGFTDDAPQANEAASSTQQGQFADAAPEAALHAAGLASAPESPESAEDGPPGLDAEAFKARNAAPTPIRPEKATTAQLTRINALRKSTGIYEAEFVALLDSYGATVARELSKAAAGYVVAALEERAS